MFNKTRVLNNLSHVKEIVVFSIEDLKAIELLLLKKGEMDIYADIHKIIKKLKGAL